MIAKTDLKLVKTEAGYYDFVLSDGELETVDSFDTAILVTLFDERRASSSEVQKIEFRRGWWGNLLNDDVNFEMGSKLWLLEQSRKTNIELNLAKTYIRQAFQWMIDGNYIKSIEIEGEFIREGFRLNVKLNVNPDQINAPFFDLWLNTGLNVSIQTN